MKERVLTLQFDASRRASRGDRRYPPSEASEVVAQFTRLTEIDKQRVLNVLRGL